MLSFYLLLSSCTCFTSSPALLLHYYMYSTNHLYVKSSSNMLLRHLTSAVLSCMLKNLCILSENVLFCPTATESNESFDLEKDIYIHKTKPFKFVSVFLKFSKDILDPELILLLIYSIVIFSKHVLYV